MAGRSPAAKYWRSSAREAWATYIWHHDAARPRKTLTQLIPKNRFPLNKFFEIAIFLQMPSRLPTKKGITHRDLKPDNMMVTDDDRVKVLAFGLANPRGGFTRMDEASGVPTVAKSEEGVIVGTVSYMSPEQAEGKSVDAGADIFSLGIIFYQTLSGRGYE